MHNSSSHQYVADTAPTEATGNLVDDILNGAYENDGSLPNGQDSTNPDNLLDQVDVNDDQHLNDDDDLLA